MVAGRLLALLALPRLLRALQFPQRHLPTPLPFCSHEPVVRIGLLVLAFHQSRLIAQSLAVLLSGTPELLVFARERRQDSVVHVPLRGGQCLEEQADDPFVDRIRSDPRADRGPRELMQRVADVRWRSWVLHGHRVAGFPAVNPPVQQRLPRPRHPAVLLPLVRAGVVADHGPNSLVRDVVDDPLRQGVRESRPDLLGLRQGGAPSGTRQRNARIAARAPLVPGVRVGLARLVEATGMRSRIGSRSATSTEGGL